MGYRNQIVLERDPNDFYREPEWVTEELLTVERFSGFCWDPAKGSGTIPYVLTHAGIDARGTDIAEGANFCFLTGHFHSAENIISNPPFSLAISFVPRALQLSRHKVAFFLRLNFLESQTRNFLLRNTPLARVWVFSNRVPIAKGMDPFPKHGGMESYAWFVWEHGWRGPPQLGWLLHREGRQGEE